LRTSIGGDAALYRRQRRLPQFVVALVALVASSSGCALWPFKDNDRSTIITPAMRAASIREMGVRAEDAGDADQAKICQELAQQIRTEPDPIVRRAIQESVAKCHAPLAPAVLVAGLSDEDRDVRTACCRLLGQRKDAEAVAPLSRIVSTDEDAEVRMAAVKALGAFQTPESIRGLAAAVKDRDPAMQYAGVKAMKEASGKDLGNDVEAWRQYAESVAPGASPALGGAEVNVAQQPGASPTTIR
jgi:hypothetical protein